MNKYQINKSNTKLFLVLYLETQALVQFASTSQAWSISINSSIWIIIQILNVSPICSGKYIHEFTDVDRIGKVDVNWTSDCYSQYKIRKRLVFDFLTSY